MATTVLTSASPLFMPSLSSMSYILRKLLQLKHYAIHLDINECQHYIADYNDEIQSIYIYISNDNTSGK